MNNFYTYELCSSATPWLPFYVGKGTGVRIYSHEKNALKNKCINKYLQRKILKILKEGNTVHYHKFNDNISEEDAFACEKVAIATFRDAGLKLCNFTDGGEGNSGWHHSKETKKKISIASKNNMTDDRRKQLSTSVTGNLNPFYNKHHTEKFKLKMSACAKGRTSWNKNKVTPKEVCDKISKSTKGRIAWNKGKTLGNRIKESKINRG